LFLRFLNSVWAPTWTASYHNSDKKTAYLLVHITNIQFAQLFHFGYNGGKLFINSMNKAYINSQSSWGHIFHCQKINDSSRNIVVPSSKISQRYWIIIFFSNPSKILDKQIHSSQYSHNSHSVQSIYRHSWFGFKGQPCAYWAWGHLAFITSPDKPTMC
jgi:hypothetical protein